MEKSTSIEPVKLTKSRSLVPELSLMHASMPPMQGKIMRSSSLPIGRMHSNGGELSQGKASTNAGLDILSKTALETITASHFYASESILTHDQKGALERYWINSDKTFPTVSTLEWLSGLLHAELGLVRAWFVDKTHQNEWFYLAPEDLEGSAGVNALVGMSLPRIDSIKKRVFKSSDMDSDSFVPVSMDWFELESTPSQGVVPFMKRGRGRPRKEPKKSEVSIKACPTPLHDVSNIYPKRLPENAIVHVQVKNCQSPFYAVFEKCRQCVRKSGAPCHFKFNRVFLVQGEFIHYGPYFLSSNDQRVLDQVSPLKKPFEFSGFEKFYKSDLEFFKSHQVMYRSPLSDAHDCKVCEKPCMTYWMCCVCGLEICRDCFNLWNEESETKSASCTYKRHHTKSQMIPMSRFSLVQTL